MVFPSFLGIGAERSGSTWLYLLLKEHPKVYMSEKRKEIHFFDRNYQKGLEWYEDFFPDEQSAIDYQAIGEITPEYLSCPECAERMAALDSVQKLILILRNPVDRAYSQYGHTVRLSDYQKSFEEYLIEHPYAIERGLYARNLEPYLEYFDRSSICCLIFEESIKDVSSTKQKLAEFLEIKSDEFPDSAGLAKVNPTYIPKFKKLNKLVFHIRKSLANRDLDWLINIAKFLGVQKVLESGAKYSLPPMTAETRLRLQNTFEPDIENLEKLFDIKLDRWRSP